MLRCSRLGLLVGVVLTTAVAGDSTEAADPIAEAADASQIHQSTVASVGALPYPFTLIGLMPFAQSGSMNASTCTSAGGSGYGYCPDSDRHYCCGVCHESHSCASNGALQACACSNETMPPNCAGLSAG